jgi:patatin-like phospholipase/acyl hydrolase
MADIVDHYYKFGPHIFTSPIQHSISTLWGLFGPRFSSSELELNLLNIFGEYTLYDLIKPCLFTGYDIKNQSVSIFTNSDETCKYSNYLVRDVVCGSSSVPSIFQPAHFLQDNIINTIVDGGVYANNPSLCAYVEVSKTRFNFKTPQQYKPEDVMILSLGTGYTKTRGISYKKSKNWGKVQWIKPILDVLLSAQSEALDYQMSKLFEGAGCPDGYKVLNPLLKYANTDFTDASEDNMDNLLKDAQEYIEEHKKEIEDFCDILIKENDPMLLR